MRFLRSHLLQSLLSVVFALLLITAAESIIAVDIARVLLGLKASLSEADVLREQLGLDLPFIERFASRIWNVGHGDLGDSYFFRLPVAPLVFEALTNSARLVVPALVSGSAIGVAIGMASAYCPRTGCRLLLAGLSALGLLPTLVLSTLVVYGAGYKLGWTGTPTLSAIGILALGPMAMTALTTRDQYSRILNSDHIRLARSLGFSEWQVATRLAFGVASGPLASLLTTLVIYLLVGTMFVEILFALPGVGSLLLTATDRLDYPMVVGIAIIFVVVIGLMDVISAVSLYALDPRVR